MKYLNQVRKFGERLSFVTAGALLSASAFAGGAGPYDAITDAVDWADAISALGLVAAALGLALVAKKGFRIVLGMIS